MSTTTSEFDMDTPIYAISFSHTIYHFQSFDLIERSLALSYHKIPEQERPKIEQAEDFNCWDVVLPSGEVIAVIRKVWMREIHNEPIHF